MDTDSDIPPTSAKGKDESDRNELVASEKDKASPELPLRAQIPYKGLNPYSEADAEIFFGRTRDTQRIINNLLAWRLTVLYGESGVGKSSVLRAGVLHALQEEAQENLEDYGVPKLAVVIFPPLQGERFWQQDPLQSLIQQIEADIGESGFPMQPPDSGLSFVEILQGWIQQLGGEHLDGRLFIILDQFEEYFQYHPREEQEGGLIAEISKAVNHPDLHVNVLISLREDSYVKLNRLRGYIPTILDICLHLEHLDKQAAQEAMTKPVERYNQETTPEQSVEITQDLVNALLQGIPRVKQSGEGRAGLEKLEPILENQILPPYLQLVMVRLWDEMVQANSHCLNLQTLTKLADQDVKDEEAAITSAIKKIVKEHVATTMRSLSAQEQDIAARSFQYLVTPSGTKYAYSVADLANLVGCESTELAELLKNLAKDQRILRTVGLSPDQPDIQRYEIFHDFLAQAILDWRRAYLERKQQKEQRERQKKQWRRQLMIGISLGIGAIILSGWQSITAYQHKVDWLTAESQQALEKFNAGQQLVALQQAMRARQQIQKQVQNNPFNFLLGQTRKVQSISQTTLTLQQILSKIQEQNQFSDPSGQVLSLDFSPDLQMIATASVDGTVKVRDVQRGTQQASFQVPGPVLDLYLDGKILVTGSADGTVQQWDWPTRQQLANFQTSGSVQKLSFSSDGQTLAIAPVDGGIVQVWNWRAQKPLITLQPSGQLLSFNLSPDGQTLATTSMDGSVQVWDGQTGQEKPKLKPTGPVLNLSFSPHIDQEMVPAR
jgi:hypothetical protein